MDEKSPVVKSEVLYDKQKIIVTYLPQNLSSQVFLKLVSAIGPLQYYKLIEKRVDHTTFNMGYGFARYESEKYAAAAIEKLNGLRICNKVLKVSKNRKLSTMRYVKNCLNQQIVLFRNASVMV